MPSNETRTVSSVIRPHKQHVSRPARNGKAVGCKNSIIFNEDFNSDNLKYRSQSMCSRQEHPSHRKMFTPTIKWLSLTKTVGKRPCELSTIPLMRDFGLALLGRRQSWSIHKQRVQLAIAFRCAPASTGYERQCERQESLVNPCPKVDLASSTTKLEQNTISAFNCAERLRCRTTSQDPLPARNFPTVYSIFHWRCAVCVLISTTFCFCTLTKTSRNVLSPEQIAWGAWSSSESRDEKIFRKAVD